MMSLKKVIKREIITNIWKIMSFRKITRYVIKSICLIVMIYQIIDITVIYLKFPFNVNIEVKSELYSRIPSISTCIPNENASNDSSINLLKVSNCSASITKFSDGKYNHIFVSECKTFSNVVQNSEEFGKCITYFNSNSSFP